MAFTYDQLDIVFPPELQQEIATGLARLAGEHRVRMNTPVPGRPNGGWPGINLPQMKAEILKVRRDAIDKWNAEHHG